jgi:hypothetical protein
MAGVNVKETGDWELAVELTGQASSRFDAALAKVLEREANRARGVVISKLGLGPPQSPNTIKTGGGGKPLVRSGELKGSINVVRRGAHQFFIGVPASAGRSMKLGRIHERGATIVQAMTPKQRRFLFAKLGGGDISDRPGTGILVIRIPARPFIGPAFDAWSREAKRRVPRELAKELGGDYGSA